MAYTETTGGGALSVAQAIASSSTASTNVFDVCGVGVGSTPSMISASATSALNTVCGVDIGAGEGPNQPCVLATVTTAAAGGSGTISLLVQAAPDSGSYTEGTYTTLTQTAALATTSLVAGAAIKIPVPPVPAGFTGLPRFYRVYYTVSGTISCSLNAYMLINAPDLGASGKFGGNFIVAV